jgi:hypothetical protein
MKRGGILILALACAGALFLPWTSGITSSFYNMATSKMLGFFGTNIFQIAFWVVVAAAAVTAVLAALGHKLSASLGALTGVLAVAACIYAYVKVGISHLSYGAYVELLCGMLLVLLALKKGR